MKRLTRKFRKSRPSANQIDPTRTGAMRAAFAQQINKMFGLIQGEIITKFVNEDALGGLTSNVFCPTGKDGGIDPTCSRSDTLPKGQWKKIETGTPEFEKYKHQIHRLINEAYKDIGGHVHAKTLKDLEHFKYWHVADIDTDPDIDVVVFGRSKFGIKAGGVGHDGTVESINMFKNKQSKLLRGEVTGEHNWWGEISGKAGYAMLSRGVPVIEDKTTATKLLGIGIKWYGEHPDPNAAELFKKYKGWYEKDFGGGQKHLKLLVGMPDLTSNMNPNHGPDGRFITASRFTTPIAKSVRLIRLSKEEPYTLHHEQHGDLAYISTEVDGDTLHISNIDTPHGGTDFKNSIGPRIIRKTLRALLKHTNTKRVSGKRALGRLNAGTETVVNMFDPNQPRDEHGRWSKQIRIQKAAIKTLLPKYEEAQNKFERLWNEHGSLDKAELDPQFQESRKQYNKQSNLLRSARAKLQRLEVEKKVIDTAPKVKHQVEVVIPHDIKVNKQLAEALVNTHMSTRPWGADESEWVNNRYRLVLKKHETKYEPEYTFSIEAKHNYEPNPKQVINEIPNRDGFVYRGMSREEWVEAASRGYIKSIGDHNLDQTGYTFYGDADTARAYATGFAPINFAPAPKVNNVVVEIPRHLVKDHKDVPDKIPAGEFAHTGGVDINNITNRYNIITTGFKPGSITIRIDSSTGKTTVSSASPPSPKTVIVRMNQGDILTTNLFGFGKKAKVAAAIIAGGANCGTGHGGFQPGNTCASSTAQTKSKTNTPEFKAWFGASKVVDKSGKPKETASVDGVVVENDIPRVVYHGTPKGEFHEFKKEFIANPDQQHFGPGFYFTEDINAARDYARGGHSSTAQGTSPTVMSFYLKSLKPFDADKGTIPPSLLPEHVRKTVRASYVQSVLSNEGRSEALQAGRDFDEGRVTYKYQHLTDSAGIGGLGVSKGEIQTILTKMGHDSITVQGPGTDANRFWIVFEPTQIKATTNKGTFSNTDPNTLNMGSNQPRDSHGRWTAQEMSAIKLWAFGNDTGDDGYEQINTALREGRTHKAVPKLVSAIIKSEPLSEDKVFHRGVSIASDSDFVKQLKVGAVIRDKGFQALTDKPETVKHFSNEREYGDSRYHFEIEIPKGFKMLPITVSGIGEYLVAPGTSMKIHSITKDQDGLHRVKASYNGSKEVDPSTIQVTGKDKYTAEIGGVRVPITWDGSRWVTANTEWQFKTSNERVEAFQKWLRTIVFKHLSNQQKKDLWRRYIEEGFKKGAGRAFEDVNPTTRPELYTTEEQKSLSDFYRGSKEEFLRSAFGHPVSQEKLELLVGRTFNELAGMTDSMANTMSRVLADGLVKGDGPRKVARDLVKAIDISKTRALTIARTELIRAHAEGQLTALENMGIEEVGVAVEWSTTKDHKVCPLCQPLQGMVLKLSEARGMLPRHPNCRCAWIPANVGEKEKGQLRTKTQLQSAIRTSQKLRKKDDWKPGTTISKTRPTSPLTPRKKGRS